MNSVIQIGEVNASSGTKKSGYITVIDVYGSPLKLPLTIINGSEDGPILCLTAGVHAMEYTGIETVTKLCAEINPKELKGAIIAVPIVNIPGFQARSAYINPLDELNLNRVFPGTPDGSISHIIAHTLFKQVVSKADYLIDLHGGDLPEENIDFVIVEKTGNKEVDEASKTIGKAFNPEYMWVKGAERGLKIEGSLCTAANKAGIPGAVPEAGHSGKVQESSVKFLLDGTINAMKHLKMIKGSPMIQEPKIIKAQHVVKAKTAGFFRPCIKLGDVASKGETIGHIRNAFGEVTEEVKAPVHGVFDFFYFHASVLPGNSLMIIGEL